MLMALVAFAACSTDRDDNPVLTVPADGSFTLYAPGITANTIDLDNSTSLTFKADQPNYGYTAPITYMMEFAASEDGNTWSSWQTTDTSNENPLAITVPTSEIASAVTSGLIELGREEADFPLLSKVKARIHASGRSYFYLFSGSAVHCHDLLCIASDSVFSLLYGRCTAWLEWSRRHHRFVIPTRWRRLYLHLEVHWCMGSEDLG